MLNILTPEKFFAQFTEDHFSDNLLLEIDQLEQMKRDLGDDAERLKIIDDLISDAKRELANQLAS